MLSPLGMTACDTYAARWASTGERDLAIEARFPELVERFLEIRTQQELLDFHLLEGPTAGPAVVLAFSGTRAITDPPLVVVEPTKEHEDGSFSLMFNPIYCSDDTPEYLHGLHEPVYAVRLLRIGTTLVLGTVIIDHGGAGDVYVTGAEWGRAIDRANALPGNAGSTRTRGSG